MSRGDLPQDPMYAVHRLDDAALAVEAAKPCERRADYGFGSEPSIPGCAIGLSACLPCEARLEQSKRRGEMADRNVTENAQLEPKTSAEHVAVGMAWREIGNYRVGAQQLALEMIRGRAHDFDAAKVVDAAWALARALCERGDREEREAEAAAIQRVRGKL